MKRLLTVAICGLLVSCAPKNEPMATQIKKQINQAIEQNEQFAKAYEAPPMAVQNALLPETQQVRPPAPQDKRFDINVNNVPAHC